MKEKYPMMRCLFAAYFNQDWEDDYDSPEAVISGFARDGDKQGIEDAIIELKMLLKEEHTAEKWGRILYDDFGCEYFFDYVDDYTPKQFLEKVQKQLEDELALAKKNEEKQRPSI